MQEEEINNLLVRYKNNQCTAAELAKLEDWYLKKADQEGTSPTQMEVEDAETQMWMQLNPARSGKKVKLWYKIAAAASVLIILSASLYFNFKNGDASTINNVAVENHIRPGGQKAILTLANGKTIYLEKNSGIEKLSKQLGVIISNINNELVYTIEPNTKAGAEEQFNKIETPNGGQYQVRLPDGTKVWLNAASSLRYPLAFVGEKRVLELKGEGYFEVAKDPEHPFIVKAPGQSVEVLGTHFNINSYVDEKYVKTTLLEGSVRLTAGNGKMLVLKPGQQALADAKQLTVNKVNTDEAIAWRNGYFNFNNEELASIMRKIARWYDVEIEYRDNVDDVALFGQISRSKNINSVLKVLEISDNVKFKIEGRRVVVMNK